MFAIMPKSEKQELIESTAQSVMAAHRDAEAKLKEKDEEAEVWKQR